MGEHYAEREIIIRIKKIEDDLCRKEKRIQDLEICVNERIESEVILREELKQKDDQIKQLLAERKTDGNFLDGRGPFNALPSDWSEAVDKPHHDLLLIGDSIVKHCNTEKILPGKSSVVACHPGAGTEKIASDIMEVLKKSTFDRIIVHAGINAIPQHSPAYVSDKIIELMEMVKQLAPKSKIAFSGLLPKVGSWFLPGINQINDSVFNTGLNKHTNFQFIQHRDFIIDRRGAVDSSLFCGDGIHLSVKGVAALERSYNRFLSK